MTSIEDILRKRSNITFFRQDKVPEKKIIDDILQKTHDLMPHKNNFYNYEIEVYGPEHFEEKKVVALATVCSTDGKRFRKSKNAKDYEELEEIYELWLESQKENNNKSKKGEYFNKKTHSEWFKNHKFKDKLKRIHFNEQVRAPYLLVYTKKEKVLTDTQKKDDYFTKGRLDEIFNVESSKDTGMWLIQSGMHSTITTALALEKGLNASFCKCYFYNTHIHTNILRKAVRDNNDIAFLLGLGYEDKSKSHYKSYVPKAKLNEIVKWR